MKEDKPGAAPPETPRPRCQWHDTEMLERLNQSPQEFYCVICEQEKRATGNIRPASRREAPPGAPAAQQRLRLSEVAAIRRRAASIVAEYQRLDAILRAEGYAPLPPFDELAAIRADLAQRTADVERLTAELQRCRNAS